MVDHQEWLALEDRLAKLAEVWLARGARQFGLWVNEKPLLTWPRSEKRASIDTISAPIHPNGNKAICLRVNGLVSAEAQQQLTNEADLLSELVTLDRDLDHMTNMLIDTRDSMLALYDLMRKSRRQVGLSETFNGLANEVARLVGAEVGVLMLKRHGRETIMAQQPHNLVLPQRLQPFIAKLMHSQEEFLLIRQQAHWPAHLRNILLIPVEVQQAEYAVLGLINKRRGEFSLPDFKLAQALAEFAGVQIENALIFQSYLQQARLESEVEMARRVHKQLYPKNVPGIPGADLWAASRPAASVSGDFYDFIPRPEHALTFAVGDVAGKGMSAALLMAMARTVIRANAICMTAPTPEELVTSSNSELYDDFTQVNMFATVFVGQYDPAGRGLMYANAGHSPVVYCPADGSPRLLEADGTALGITPQAFSRNQHLSLQPNDVIVVGTDGINEAQNDSGEMFGYNDLLQLVSSLADQPARAIAETLFQTVDEFSSGQAQQDDQTLVVLKVTS